MIINYTELKDSIFGMISKKDIVTETNDFYVIRKNKSKVYFLPKKPTNIDSYKDLIDVYKDLYKHMSFGYVLDSDYNLFKTKYPSLLKGKSWSETIISVFDPMFFKLEGKIYRELRETRNKYDKTIKCIKYDISNKETLNKYIFDLLKTWDETSGQKYGWHRHSGYDRFFFEQLSEDNINNYQVLLFYDQDDLVGYSVISYRNNDNTYSYLIRKFIPKYRNIGLYIDFASFRQLSKTINKQDFKIHWGASSGSLLLYKKKFPVYKTEKTWFFSINK